ncbi:MAG TPA: hypothetical protein VGH38_18110 [Bryobacteraceae bacterium]
MWLIYALGGGWGHLTRAVALARRAERHRAVRILTNSRYAGMVAAALPSLDLAILDSEAPAEVTRRAVVREILECGPSCLIVDTFPRGIGGELAGVLGTLEIPKVLVHRDLNPYYVSAARLRTFVEAHYDLVLVPGAGEGLAFGGLRGAWTTAPWLVRSADELPDRENVARLLRLAPGQEHCVLVLAAGKEDELQWYLAVVRELARFAPDVPVRLVAAERPPDCAAGNWVSYWPAMDLFGCAAVVVGGAGYNTVQECLAWGVPLVARAWPRRYDRQELRAARGLATLVLEPEEAARTALRQMRDATPAAPAFVNGVGEAVARIVRLEGSSIPAGIMNE